MPRWRAQHTCFACGMNKTFINNKGRQEWRLNHDVDGNALCFRCYQTLLGPPPTPENKKKYNARRLATNGHIFYIGWMQRIGICNFCCAVAGINCVRTHWHHERGFFIIFPWFGVVELCGSCHSKESHRLSEVPPKNRKILSKNQ